MSLKESNQKGYEIEVLCVCVYVCVSIQWGEKLEVLLCKFWKRTISFFKKTFLLFYIGV